MKEYRINEIFYSLQGEGRNTGQAAVFIRFSGCNLHCTFCDTDFTEYTLMTLDDIMRQLEDFPTPQSTGVAIWCILTGGTLTASRRPTCRTPPPARISGSNGEQWYTPPTQRTGLAHGITQNSAHGKPMR